MGPDIGGFVGFLDTPQPWKRRGACRDTPTPVFFPERGQHADAARGVCDCCPVKEPCYEYGVSTGSHGVWGGVLLTPRESYTIPQCPCSIDCLLYAMEFAGLCPSQVAGDLYTPSTRCLAYAAEWMHAEAWEYREAQDPQRDQRPELRGMSSPLDGRAVRQGWVALG